MQEFFKKEGLPLSMARWQPTVDAMLKDIDSDGPIYLMVDQKIVQAGVTHRRPNLHIDGYWCEQQRRHKGDGSHITNLCRFDAPEGLILASDVEASRALIGTWVGGAGDGGDCSHIDVSHLREVRLEAGYVWAGNVTNLHESLPVVATGPRTLVRLNVPGWTPACSNV